jgi:uncharacterized membrane protein YuzA (DUF378 family)
MKVIHVIAFVLLVIGGLNWLLIAFNPGWNIVQDIFGIGLISNVIYFLVGLSAVYLAIVHGKDCKVCSSKAMPTQQPMQPK